MRSPKHTAKLALSALLLIPLLVTGVAAEEKITVENGEVKIEDKDSGKVVIIDAEGIGQIISESMDEVMVELEHALSEMDDLQFEMRLGDDNRLSFETEDQAFEVDLDIIFNEIGQALGTAFEDLDTSGWTGHHHFHIDDEDLSEDDLKRELKNLKKELRKLQEELDKVKEL